MLNAAQMYTRNNPHPTEGDIAATCPMVDTFLARNRLLLVILKV